MKPLIKSAAFLFLLLLVSTLGCKKDKSANELIIGKWEVKTMKLVYYENNVKTSESTQLFGSKEMELEIRNDGTGSEYENLAENEVFTWSMNGSSVTVRESGMDDVVMTVTVTENNLTLVSVETELYEGTTYKYETTITANRE